MKYNLYTLEELQKIFEK